MADEILPPETALGLTPGAAAIKSAGQTYLASLSDDAKAAPLGVPEDPDDAETETETEPPARDGSGKFAKKEKETDATTDEAEGDAVEETDPEAGTEDEGDAVEEGAPTVVVLKGLSDRGEADIEIDVADEETAVRLRRLQNDGIRKEEYTKLVAAHQDSADELAELQAVAEANPVGFMVGMIQPDRRLEVARALLTECFEDLKPDIEKFYEDPTAIRERKLELKEQASTDSAKAQSAIANRRAAGQIMAATEALIPDGVDPHLHAQFVRDAERDLIDAVKAGERLAPADVPRLLQRRLKMYGFAARDTATARPVSDAAKAIAAKRDDAKASQARLKRNQISRKSAQAIPPGGRGAAVVTQPLVAKGASIKDAGRAVLKSGATSWADLRK